MSRESASRAKTGDDHGWEITEEHLDLSRLGWSESVFALSNGHLGLRGNLDEGEPFHELGTYLNGVYELRPLPYAEAGFGYPESGESIINVTNGKLIRLLVDDEPFDVRYGTVTTHRRTLDMRAGVLRREVEWTSPADQTVRINSTRMVSLTQRAVAAIRYEVEAVDAAARIVLQSELVVNEPVHEHVGTNTDPRAATALRAPLVGMEHFVQRESVVLVHTTKKSGLRLAAGMDHLLEGPTQLEGTSDCAEDLGRFTVTATLEPGERIVLIKLLGYGWSSVRSQHALRDQAAAALHAARATGWDGLLAEQRRYLDDFWDRACLSVEGDPELERAVRFSMFHALQSSARAEGQAIPAKGLTGSGYDGHAFWDMDTFLLPFLIRTTPRAARDALEWRHSTLSIAKDRAEMLGLKGAAFPWRTITGEECSGYWPAGTAAFHLNAGIAMAVARYVEATDDVEFESTRGTDLLVETARLLRSLGHHDRNGRFHIDGVTGPDEYSALADDNVYTNLTARYAFLAALSAVGRYPDRASGLGVDDTEIAQWTAAADHMYLPFDDALGVHQQSEGFTGHQEWDFAATLPEQYPLQSSFPYFDIYRKQVIKQADLVLAMHHCPDDFTPAQKARNFAYYERRTVRDSSLSAPTQAVIAAELGHLQLAEEYLVETAFVDLMDLQSNTRDGVHLAASVGAWSIIVDGFGGTRVVNGELRFAPRISTRMGGVSFGLIHLGRHLRVDITPDEATYTLVRGEPIEIFHHGSSLELDNEPQVFAIPERAEPPRVRQPSGREPFRRPRD